MTQPVFLVMETPRNGKSTVSRALAARFALGLHVPVDDLRHMVAGGISDMDFVSDPDASRRTGMQIQLAQKAASQMARTYHQAGFAVAIDDFWFNEFTETPFQPGFAGVPETHCDLGEHVRKVVLLPSLDVTVARLRGRDGEASILEAVIRQNHAIIRDHPKPGWLVVDSSDLSVAETVNWILEHA